MDPDNRWTSDGRLVCFSDLGFIAKKSDDEITVFVNSITSGQPVSDATVSFISTNNQQVFHAVTDGEGVAKFSDMSKQAANFKVNLITATSGEEF
ncbi:MAG: hypothetical protein CUN57_03630, partial [Phototrophicales bacterium]